MDIDDIVTVANTKCILISRYCSKSSVMNCLRFPYFLLHKSPTYEPSSCELSKMRTCICMSNQKLVHVSGIHCQIHASSTSLLLLMILQLYHLSALLPPPVSNSSCLFTPCQALYSSYCTLLLLFSRYCIVRLKMSSLFSVFVFMHYLCEKYYKPITVL